MDIHEQPDCAIHNAHAASLQTACVLLTGNCLLTDWSRSVHKNTTCYMSMLPPQVSTLLNVLYFTRLLPLAIPEFCIAAAAAL